MTLFSLVFSKAILAICNLFVLVCGVSLITGGVLLLADTDRILLSKLLLSEPYVFGTQPILYYLAIILACLGLILASTGILGCWASCMHSYTILIIYFLIILTLLIGECAVYILIWLWPNCLGLGLDPTDLIKGVQGKYGAVGEEQFTAAYDLAQTIFECCGTESANEYDTSLWRLQAFSPSFAIPLTCCKLSNFNDPKAYLDPKPINSTLCQALEVNRHEGYRHTKGCIDSLQQWYRQHYLMLLGIGLTVVIVEFFVLLSVILTCTRIYKSNQKSRHNPARPAKVISRATPIDTISQRPPTAYSNETYALTNSFRQNYKLIEKL